MAVQYIKYQISFKNNTNTKSYRVYIYGTIPSGNPPATIHLIPSDDSPLVISEDDNDNFFAPIRTQTGSIKVCTKLENGGTLDPADILPNTNTSTPVLIWEKSQDSPNYIMIWSGFLGCEIYNQDYVGYADFIELPIISKLEAWKYIHIENNDVRMIGDLIDMMISNTPSRSSFSSVVWPKDGDLEYKLINTSIFIKKKEYVNEESHLYTLEGHSFHNILETICKFMGWTAREDKNVLYFELLQGYGLLYNTETRDMSTLQWHGTGHQRSVRQGKRVAQVTAKLAEFKIDTGLPEIPYGSFDYESYKQIGQSMHLYRPWVYFLPSSDTIAYSNIVLNFYFGEIQMGSLDNDYYYSFVYLGALTSDAVYNVIETSIPLANMMSRAYDALNKWDGYTNIFAGACFARMQFDEPNDPDYTHSNTKDGILVSLFPGAWEEHTEYNRPIFTMKSVQAFAAIEDGFLNIDAILTMFNANLDVGTNLAQHKLMLDLQIGNMVWTGSEWLPKEQYIEHFFVEYNSDCTKFKDNWDASMDIDEIHGLCIPTTYTENGVTKHVMGEIILRMYPETKFYEKITTSSLWRNFMVFNIFFEKLEMKYYPKKSVKRTDRSENNYRTNVNNSFDEEVSIESDIASWLNNNPSPSLLYNEDDTLLQTLLYYKQDGVTTVSRRPETDLLNRMKEYYKQPRTILKLDVKHIDGKPLPLLRFNGLDGKLYTPVAESRDFRTEDSTLTCLETPQ